MSSVVFLASVDAWLRRLPRPLVLVSGLAGLALLAVLDAADAHRVTLEPFYLLPVLYVAWITASSVYGLVTAVVATLIEPIDGFLFSSHWPATEPSAAWLVADAVAQMLLYLLMLWILAALRKHLDTRESQALRDPLTGLANARAFNLDAASEINRSRRYKHQLSLIYLDIDDFKDVNDRFGHGEGDRLLRRLSELITATLRSVDTAARLGGDEFAILMPETGVRDADRLAQRLMAAVAASHVDGGPPLSCSLGLVTFRTPPASVEALLEAGDREMYEAKAAGKGRLSRTVLPVVRTRSRERAPR